MMFSIVWCSLSASWQSQPRNIDRIHFGSLIKYVYATCETTKTKTQTNKRNEKKKTYQLLTPLCRQNRRRQWSPTLVLCCLLEYLQHLPPHSSSESSPGLSCSDCTFGWSAQTAAPIALLPVSPSGAPALKRLRLHTGGKVLSTPPTEGISHCLHWTDRSHNSHSGKPWQYVVVTVEQVSLRRHRILSKS